MYLCTNSQSVLPCGNRKIVHVKPKSESDQGNDVSRPRAAIYDPHLLYFDDGDESLEEYSNDDISKSFIVFQSIPSLYCTSLYYWICYLL